MAAPLMRRGGAGAAGVLLLAAVAAFFCAQHAAADVLNDVVPIPGRLITQGNLPPNLRKAATPQVAHGHCGTANPPEKTIAITEADLLALQASRANQRKAGLARKKIRVVFHNIVVGYYDEFLDETYYQGLLGKDLLTAQVATLNSAFAGKRKRGNVDTNFRFSWNSQTDWYIYDVANITDADYFNVGQDSTESFAIKSTFRKGNSATLNVYTVNLVSSDPKYILLGYATFPKDYNKKALYDGVMMNYQAMTGGGLDDFSEGVTLAHEAGHWVGLFHTFMGGCNLKKGDYVSDTVPEATSASGCPKNRKTCKGKGYNTKWRDPVDNIMDYTTDKCRTTLTKGQATRADTAWAAYRGCAACLKINGEAPTASK